jgi:gamma-glutamyltranspeptidase/glutathione hydrolase/leukotriene-C4 hydrolase
MDDFSTPGAFNYFHLEPSEANLIEPSKRPMSSQSPIIIVDKNDNVRLVLGASGGSKIISGVSQVALKILWMNTDLKSAIDAKRIHHQLYPEFLELEHLFPEVIYIFFGLSEKVVICKCGIFFQVY